VLTVSLKVFKFQKIISTAKRYSAKYGNKNTTESIDKAFGKYIFISKIKSKNKNNGKVFGVGLVFSKGVLF